MATKWLALAVFGLFSAVCESAEQPDSSGPKLVSNNSTLPVKTDPHRSGPDPPVQHQNTSTSPIPFSNLDKYNWDAIYRASYVFGGLCLLVALYLVFRAWRLRRRRAGTRRTGTRKYLPLGRQAKSSSQEMEPLGQADDDDDADEDTLFETSPPERGSAS